MNIIDNLHVSSLTATAMTLPASCVTDAAVEAAAGIDATKLDHQYVKGHAYESATAIAADAQYPIHVAYAAGTLVAFLAGNVVATTGTHTCVVDLLKNGTTVLSATITLTSGSTARVSYAGTVSATTYVAGDVFEVKYDWTTGTNTAMKGIFCYAVFREAASP